MRFVTNFRGSEVFPLLSFRNFNFCKAVLVTGFVLISCDSILFRRTQFKKDFNPMNIPFTIARSWHNFDNKGKDTNSKIPPIFSQPMKVSRRDKRRLKSKNISSSILSMPLESVNEATISTSSTNYSTLLSRNIAEEFSGESMRYKVTTGIAESVFNEIFRGLTDYSALLGDLGSPVTVRGMLVDMSMSAWTAAQNYLRYRDSANWRCDDESCVLTDDAEAVSPAAVPLSATAAVPCEAPMIEKGNKEGEGEGEGTVAGSSERELLQPRLTSGAMVSFLIPLDERKAQGEEGKKVEGFADNNGLPVPLSDTEAGKCYIFASHFPVDHNHSQGEVAVAVRQSAPLPAPTPVALTGGVGAVSSVQSVLQCFLASLLVNLLSHELLPALFHQLEAALGQLVT